MASRSAQRMKAVVMAGGEGSRLRPLTVTRPKPMVPIVGRPVMEHILKLLKQHGISEVVVTVAVHGRAQSRNTSATARSSA